MYAERSTAGQQTGTTARKRSEQSPTSTLQMLADSSYSTQSLQALQRQADQMTEETADETGKSATGTAFKIGNGEAHTLYLEGDPENPKVMVASAPAEARQVIKSYFDRHKLSVDAQGETKLLTDAIAATTNLTKHYAIRKAQRASDWSIKASEYREAIIAGLQWVFTQEIGDVRDFVINWLKPQTLKYPTLYFGPTTNKHIPQRILYEYYQSYQKYGESQTHFQTIHNIIGERDFSNWQKARPGRYIQGKVIPYVSRHDPHNETILPSGDRIGLGLGSLIDEGINGPYRLRPGDSTPGGTKINNILAKNGFSPSEEGLQGDHVLEIQMGGVDEISNLWPLDTSYNTASGAWLNAVTAQAYSETPFFVSMLVLKLMANHEVINLRINVDGSATSKYAED